MATIFCILSRNSIPFRSLFFLPSSYPFLVINSQRTFQQTNEHSHNAIFSFPLKLFGSAKGLIFTLGSCFPFCSVSLIQTMKFSMHRNVCTWLFSVLHLSTMFYAHWNGEHLPELAKKMHRNLARFYDKCSWFTHLNSNCIHKMP